jgi:cyclopropane fatty-acyl-phospholipid synthase-like methyltransferase
VNSSDRQSEAFFEARYQASSDPWRFASSTYELNRYHATLRALSRSIYRRGFEPGCSIGVLTAALAGRVEHLIACDIAESAVASAKERCRGLSNVQIYHRDAADGPPDGSFDLIVFSELGYYFSVDQLKTMARQTTSRLEPGGEFVAVHWLGHSADHVLHGDVVHEVLTENLACEWIGGSRHPGFRIDSWRQVS